MREQKHGNHLEEAPTAWMDRANCFGVDQKVFFPGKGENPHAAKAICARCVVQEECLEYALRGPSVIQGVWGGTTSKERWDILRRRRKSTI